MASVPSYTWETVGQHWDMPRLNAWNRMTGHLPPLHLMVGRYLGYKKKEAEAKPLTPEEHAKRLLGQLGIGIM